MGKKGNTLNDLSKFLESEQNAVLSALSIEEKDYFQKKPISLVSIEIDDLELPVENGSQQKIAEPEAKSTETAKKKDKFVDSSVLKKTSFQEVEDQIKTLALENNMTVQQVLSALYFNSASSFSSFNFFQFNTAIQKTYWKFWTDLQKSFLKR